MNYLLGRNANGFTCSSSGKSILSSSINSLQPILGTATIQQHANNPFSTYFRFVLMLTICEVTTALSLFRLHDSLQPPSFVFIILLWYSGFSLLTFGLYYLDQNHWPVRINTLHFFEFNGGWPGALAAQKLLRHEIREPGYQSRFENLVMLNVFLLTACGVLYNWEWTSESVNIILEYVKDRIHNFDSWIATKKWFLYQVGGLLALTCLPILPIPFAGIGISLFWYTVYGYQYKTELMYIAVGYVLFMVCASRMMNPRNRRA